MPSAADFAKAFGLKSGQRLGETPYSISHAHVGHTVREVNEHYKFPTELALTREPAASAPGGRRDARQAEEALAEHVEAQQGGIIYSAYGSPYECRLGRATCEGIDEAGEVLLRCTGTAARRRDIPTLQAVKEEERRAAGVSDDINPDDRERYLSDCRVTKSRFGTSRCSVCEGVIYPGMKIVRRQGGGAPARGGLAHATCLLQRRKAAAKGRVRGQGSGRGQKAAKDGRAPTAAAEEKPRTRAQAAAKSKAAADAKGEQGRAAGARQKTPR